MLSRDKINAIRTLHKEGLSNKDIAEQLGVSQPTVRAYVLDDKRGDAPAYKGRTNRIKGLSQANQDALLELYKLAGYNSELMTMKINADPTVIGLPASFKIAARTVRRYMAEVAHGSKRSAKSAKAQEIDGKIGSELQVDFTPAKFRFAGDDFERTVYIFAAVYPWSHQTYFRVFPDMSLASCIEGLVGCLIRYGVPKTIRCDKESLLVDSNYDSDLIEFNSEFDWICKQLSIEDLSCKIGCAQSKGVVARAQKYLKRTCFGWINLFHPEVKDIAHLNTLIEEWNDTCASVDRKFEVDYDSQRVTKIVKELYKLESKQLHLIDRKDDLLLSCKMLLTDGNGHMVIQGHHIDLGKQYANQELCAMVFSNGHYQITTVDCIQVKEGILP